MVDSLDILGPFPAHKIFNGLLLVLQVLHIIWFYMILRMVHEFIVKGQVMMTLNIMKLKRKLMSSPPKPLAHNSSTSTSTSLHIQLFLWDVLWVCMVQSLQNAERKRQKYLSWFLVPKNKIHFTKFDNGLFHWGIFFPPEEIFVFQDLAFDILCLFLVMLTKYEHSKFNTAVQRGCWSFPTHQTLCYLKAIWTLTMVWLCLPDWSTICVHVCLTENVCVYLCVCMCVCMCVFVGIVGMFGDVARLKIC